MNKLYCVPLGSSARQFFINEIEQHGWESSILVLPSGVLQNRAYLEGAVRVKNFDDIAVELLNANGYAGLKRISRRTQELIIEDLLKDYAAANQLPYFDVLTDKKGFIKAAASLMGQLSRSGAKMEEINDALKSWDRQGKYGLKDREIAAVYTAYRSRLKKEGWFDVEGLYRLAVYVLQQDNPVVPWQHLYFSEFYRFDGLQTELLKELQRHCGINIGLMYEPGRPELFAAVENTFGDLGAFLKIEKLPADKPLRAPSLTVVAESLGGESSAAYDGSGITLLEASSREQEIRTVLRSVKKLLQNGTAAGDIIILLRDFSLYAGLRDLSDEYGIPVSLPQTVKLNNELLTEFIYLMIKKAAAAAPAAEADNLWQLLGCQAAKMLFKLDTEKLLRLKADKFYQSAAVFTDDALNALDDNGREELMRLLDMSKAIQPADSVDNYCSTLLDILEKLNIPQTLGEAYQADRAGCTAVKNYLLAQAKLKDVLAMLQTDYAAGGRLNRKITAQEFADIFYEAVQGVELVLQRGDLNGVLITEAANIQGVYYRHVFLLGVREGEFPALKTENWIYNDRERSEMAALGIDLPGTIAGLNEDRYFFAACAAAALQSLTVSWYSDGQGGASAYVEMLQNTFADNSLKITSCPAVTAETAMSPQELAEKLAAADRKNAWLDANFDSWAERTEIERRRMAGFDNYSGVLTDTQLIKELQQKIGTTFSASRLETYAKCPFRFLANYLWRQTEYAEADEGIAYADEGSLMHDAAAEFTSRYYGKRINTLALPALLEEMQQIFEELCTQYQQSGKLKDTVFLPWQKETILKYLLNFVKAEYAYAESWADYTPAKTEIAFGPGTGLPVSVACGDGQQINLQGRIDRIDIGADGVYITDYKRSSTPGLTDMKQGLDMQMPLYLLAAEQMLKDKHIAGGGYFSFINGKRENGIFFDAAAKPPFIKQKTPDNWQEFIEAAKSYIANYVAGMRSGDFKPLAVDSFCDYCPARDICRRNTMNTAGGTEENV